LPHYIFTTKGQSQLSENTRRCRRHRRDFRLVDFGSTRSSANGSVARSDGSLCNTPAEITERWREHYQNTLNHSNVTPSADLDDFADSATPDVTVSEDVPMLHEVTTATDD